MGNIFLVAEAKLNKYLKQFPFFSYTHGMEKILLMYLLDLIP